VLYVVTGREIGSQDGHASELYVSKNYGKSFTSLSPTLYNGSRAAISQFVNNPVYMTHVSPIESMCSSHHLCDH